MKKIILLTLLVVLTCSYCFAFPYEIELLTSEETSALSDEALVDIYIEAKIEVNASKIFFGRSGFTPKDYKKYKELLGYIVRVRQEMHDRDIDAPPVDEWLR